MKTKEVIDSIKAERPALLRKISDKRAARLIRKAYNQLHNQIESADDGEVIRVPGLGKFKVKQVEREQDGQTAMTRRVVFRAKKPPKDT